MAAQRFHHLDAVRGFCLVYGFFVHATNTAATDMLSFVGDASSFFRMAAFFLVSGFFGAMLMQRMSGAAFLRKRALNLLVPLATGLVLLNPVTIYLIYIYHNQFVSPIELVRTDLLETAAGPMPWHLHLWFLISLFAYALLTPLMVRVAALPVIARALARFEGVRLDVLLIALAACAGAGAVLGRSLEFVVLKPLLETTPFAWVVKATLAYMPFYMIGVLAFAHQSVYRALHRPGWLGLAAGAVMFGILTVWLTGGGEGVAGKGAATQVAFFFAKSFVILIVVAALLAVGAALFSEGKPFVRYISDRIYTGYMIHFLIIYILALALRPLDLGPILQYALVIGGTLVIAFWLHGRVIARSQLLLLLFNGKVTGRRAAAATVPDQIPVR